MALRDDEHDYGDAGDVIQRGALRQVHGAHLASSYHRDTTAAHEADNREQQKRVQLTPTNQRKSFERAQRLGQLNVLGLPAKRWHQVVPTTRTHICDEFIDYEQNCRGIVRARHQD